VVSADCGRLGPGLVRRRRSRALRLAGFVIVAVLHIAGCRVGGDDNVPGPDVTPEAGQREASAGPLEGAAGR
jgi:hypothetical protein